MADRTELSDIVTREYTNHSMDEVPEILQEYITAGTASFTYFLNNTKDENGKRAYSWLIQRYKSRRENKSETIFSWLRRTLSKQKSLIDIVEELDKQRRTERNQSTQHNISEAYGILETYLEEGNTSFLRFLNVYVDEGARVYRWLPTRYYRERGPDSTNNVLDWLESQLVSNFSEQIKKTQELIAKAREKNNGHLRYSDNVDDVRKIVGAILANRGNYTKAAQELGYQDHTALTHRLDILYERFSGLAEVVYLTAVGQNKLHGRLQQIHYRKLDEGLAAIQSGDMTMQELAVKMGYKSTNGLYMLINRRERK